MKKLLSIVFVLSLSLLGQARAAGGGHPLDAAPDRLNDLVALQNGAKLFVNYCLNCHAASFIRYNRMLDLGLDSKQIEENLMFAGEKIGELMSISAKASDQKAWFGAPLPDLTLVARSRASERGSGADYLYSYLRGYYRDPSTATGWNNLIFPNVAMPNPFWQLQGQRVAKFKEVLDPHTQSKTMVFEGYETYQPGLLSEKDFDSQMGDLVAYMQWLSEPNQLQRKRIGVWVLAFLSILIFCAWRLNASFWKDVK